MTPGFIIHGLDITIGWSRKNFTPKFNDSVGSHRVPLGPCARNQNKNRSPQVAFFPRDRNVLGFFLLIW